MNWTRRDFFRASAIPATGISLATASRSTLAAGTTATGVSAQPFYSIGLSQISLHRTISSGQLHPLDYPQFAIDQFGIEQVDVFTGVMPERHERLPFLRKLRLRSDQAGTNIFAMMVEPIRLISDNRKDRLSEVARFHPLVDQANVVGARLLHVCLDRGAGPLDKQTTQAVDVLKRLADYARSKDVSIAIQSRVGASCNGLWLARVMKEVNHPNCASIPDFGKFASNDTYAGMAALIESAGVITAKSHAFEEEGLELQSDYPKLFQMIVDSGFRGVVAIEYEGQKSEVEGIMATQKLLQRLHESFAV